MKRIRNSLLPRLSVSRPVTVKMVIVAVLVVGAIAYLRIPIKLLPGVPMTIITVPERRSPW